MACCSFEKRNWYVNMFNIVTDKKKKHLCDELIVFCFVLHCASVTSKHD